ncbi:MAG: hypothetical protein PWQ59_2232 [Thermoanaerobacterium sp.]|nr:hypothetical protein [Thermoanaerobacterium sp.]
MTFRGDTILAGNRSFKDYVADRFENELFDAIQSYIEDKYDDLDLRLYKVRNIGDIELSDIEVKFVSVNDLPGMKIEFDVVVEAYLEVRELDYHYDESEYCNQWFMLKCLGDLDSNLDDFTISSVTEYIDKNKQPKPMSDSLVPIIYKEQLESVATDFLRRHYPEALKNPMAIEPQVLAEKMGLRVEMREITKDFSVFGQIFFHDCEAEVYDKDSDEMVQTHVDAQTIFVDPKAYFLRNLGSVNNTIVHECVHWDLHRKAFELERLYNSSVTRIKCQVVGGIKDSNKDATDWMERQANALAPRIQMPISTFKKIAFEFIKQYKKEIGTDELIDVMEPVIDALATFFGVSRLAAKIRMIDVGYEEAIGTFTYIDGRYVKPHRFKKGILQRNQTFSIGAIDAAIQSLTNPEMSSLVRDGSYLYVDSHFVLNHPKYLTQDIYGNTVLTDYARTHMEECCLIFELSVKSGCRERYYSECFLNRDKTSNIDFDIKYCNGFEYATPERKVKILADILEEEARIYSELPNSYTKSLQMVIEWRGVTYKELGERILLNEKTVRRIVNGETKGSINSLVLICLGLHLSPKISRHIIDNSPHSLNISDKNHQWYDFALAHLYTKSMDEIRQFLHQYGADPL